MPQKKKSDKNDKNDDDNKPAKVNFDDLIRSNLSEIRYSADRQTFGYTVLNLCGKKQERSIESIPSTFGNYRFLKNIDLSYNTFTDMTALSVLPNLINLNVRRNNITSLKSLNREGGAEGEEVEYWKSLQWINFSGNKISELGPIKAPNLLW